LGQNDLGIAPFVDHSVYCMTPDYGTNVQLEKEALLTRSEIVVMNKRDYPQAEAKARRVRTFLGEGRTFILTEAKNHGDAGLTELFERICHRSGVAVKPLDLEAEAAEAAARRHALYLARSECMGGVVDAHEDYYKELEREIETAKRDEKRAAEWRRRYDELWALHGFDGDRAGLTEKEGVLYRKDPQGRPIPVARLTTCDIWVPVLGLPPRNADPAQIIAYLYKQNVPGDFPFTEGAFRFRRSDEDPIRMFAGLGLPETTNARFHLLCKRGGAPRLSTAFDSLTLYGLDSDEPGALAKVGEGGVAVDTIDDMKRLYQGFNLEEGSVSLTMSGPAPMVLALYFAAARRRGFDLRKMRGTIQTDILKEIQAQNEAIFPLEPSLRLIGDMFEYTMRHAPRFYPISISGYHIGEAGANPIQEMAFTLANGFTYAEMLGRRGLDLEEVARRFSFFFTSGSEMEFNVLGRVARRIWAVGMKRYFGVEGPGQRLKFHSQTSGRSLQDVEPLHNLARVTVQAEYALNNNANSLHTNSYKETYSTPEEDDVILAMGCQQIPLRETGAYRFIENLHQGAYGISYLEDEVERAVHRIFREIDQQGGVVAAIENEYFRSLIQEEVQKEQRARSAGQRTIVGVNYLNYGDKERPRGALVNIPTSEKRRQVARTKAFKRAHGKKAAQALERLKEVARGDGNVFEEMIRAVEHVTVGQITHALWDVWGRFRASM
jgi:methylmalonyl-CoA mutase